MGKYWKLFSTEEDRFYRTESLGDFAKDRVLSTCRNWILMLDEDANFYILNPFTLEILDLPASNFNRRGKCLFDRASGEWFRGRLGVEIRNAILWVDERTHEYFVMWSLYEHTTGCDYIAYCKDGDEEWRGFRRFNGCVDLAFKDNKLYMCTRDGSIKIFGFDDSGSLRDIRKHPYTCPFIPNGLFVTSLPHVKVGIRLTESGDVLMVLRVRSGKRDYFRVYRNDGKTWKEVYPFGEEEALVWDLSVTLPTKGITDRWRCSLVPSVFWY